MAPRPPNSISRRVFKTRKGRMFAPKIHTTRGDVSAGRCAEVLIVCRAALVRLNRGPHQGWLNEVLVEDIDVVRVVLHADPDRKEGQILARFTPICRWRGWHKGIRRFGDILTVRSGPKIEHVSVLDTLIGVGRGSQSQGEGGENIRIAHLVMIVLKVMRSGLCNECDLKNDSTVGK